MSAWNVHHGPVLHFQNELSVRHIIFLYSSFMKNENLNRLFTQAHSKNFIDEVQLMVTGTGNIQFWTRYNIHNSWKSIKTLDTHYKSRAYSDKGDKTALSNLA